MGEQLSEAEHDRDIQRGYILSLAGFSFTAVAALLVLDRNLQLELQLPIWYVLVSFIAFMASLNLHAYKSSRWQSQFATALQEAGSFSLILTLLALVFGSKFSEIFQYSALTLCLGVWSLDQVTRIALEFRYFRELDLVAREKLEG